MHAPGYHLIPCTSNLLFFTTPSSLYNCKLWNYLRLWQRKRAWYPAMKSSTLSPLVYTSVSKSDLSGFLHPRTFLWLHEQKIKKCPNGISLKKSSACFCHLLFLQSALQTTFVSDCAVLHKNFIACAMNWTVRHLQLGQPMSTFRSFGYVVASGSQKKRFVSQEMYYRGGVTDCSECRMMTLSTGWYEKIALRTMDTAWTSTISSEDRAYADCVWKRRWWLDTLWKKRSVES